MNLKLTDPEFMERFEHFAFEQIPNEEGQQLDDATRYLAILAALIGCQGIDEYRLVLSEALDGGMAPAAVKETVYQAVDYLGIGRVLPFLNISNEVFAAHGIALPLEGQCTTTMENRLEKGAQIQAEIFGEHMKEAWKAGPMNRFLAANCFGDYYTRTGLALAQRELITFCFLAAQGGCEPQLTAHAAGNMNLGNDKAFLTRVVSQCLPYIGYPRSLNAITCINSAAETEKKAAGKDRARELFPGDVVVIPAGVKHWHGAAKDSWFTHLAVEVPGENTGNEWLERVKDDDYAALR